jgi:hypothetical protein
MLFRSPTSIGSEFVGGFETPISAAEIVVAAWHPAGADNL